MNKPKDTIRISEIFFSLQGESTTTGLPTIFVRLTGCPLRCQYCDTAYAFRGGNNMHIEEILAKIETYPCKRICVTGGEPLAQALCLELLTTFCNQGYNVSLETSGAIDISLVDERVMIVMDIKTPASLEASKNLLSNLSFIKKTDQIKFVLCNEKDYLFAKDFLQEHALIEKTQVLFSPSYQELSPQALANWILRDGLEVRFQIQLHKILWGDAQGH